MKLWWLAAAVLLAASASQAVTAQVTDAGDTAALLAFKSQISDVNVCLSLLLASHLLRLMKQGS